MSRLEPFYDADFLTVHEVANLLRVSKMSVYRLIQAGELRGVKKFGKTIRVPRECLNEFIQRAHYPPAPAHGNTA